MTFIYEKNPRRGTELKQQKGTTAWNYLVKTTSILLKESAEAIIYDMNMFIEKAVCQLRQAFDQRKDSDMHENICALELVKSISQQD